MSKIIAVNDIKAKCGNFSFRECRVVFRRNPAPAIIPVKLLISHLIKPTFIKHKDNFICYCDGIIEIETPAKVVEEQDEYYEDPIAEDPFPEYNLLEKSDLAEEIERIYQKEKRDWIHRLSKNQDLIDAINMDYDCDEAYCKERASQEYPGFLVADHTTFYYKIKMPSHIGMELEKALTKQLNSDRAKYGTMARIVELEKHNNICCNDEEAIVIYNYLNKFELIGLVSVVEKTVYGRQFERSGSGS